MEWKPIDTAPLDGTEILILAQGMAIQARFIQGEWQSHHEDGLEFQGPAWCAFDDALEFEVEEDTESLRHGAVTHWMKLPAMPNET